MALLFDFVLVWPLDRLGVSPEDTRRTRADIEFLREHNVAKTVGFNMPFGLSIQTDKGATRCLTDLVSSECDLVMPFLSAVGGTRHQNNFEYSADRVIAGAARQMMYNDAPVVAHSAGRHLISTEDSLPVALQVTLGGIPLPAESLPWIDFIDFRSDPENVARLRALRLWLQRQSSSMESARHLQEEAESLLYDYRKYMRLQGIKFGDGVISTLVASTGAIASHILSLNFGAAFGRLFEVRKHHIALEEAELGAPGRELSYIARAHQFVQDQNRRVR